MIFTVYDVATGQILVRGKSNRLPNLQPGQAVLEGIIAPPNSYIDQGAVQPQKSWEPQATWPTTGTVRFTGIPTGTLCNGISVDDDLLEVTSDVSGDIVLVFSHPQYVTKSITVTFP